MKHASHIRLAVLLAANLILFGTTNAATASPGLMVLGFGLILVTAYFVMHWLVGGLKFYGVNLTNRRRRHLATYLTVLVGLLVAMQSIGGVNARDLLVLVPLATLGYVYAFYVRRESRDF